MFVAHAPAGYLLGKAMISPKAPLRSSSMGAVVLGSIFPDLDMLYFHLIDKGQVHHHMYVTHWPLVWIGLTLITLLIFRSASSTRNLVLYFSLGGVLHNCLDTIASPVYWLAPFSYTAIELVTVPATYNHWIFSFLLHWTFGIELLIILAATVMFYKDLKR
ncbi:metal-dependent hydrolase [Flexibacterium corallicola]|uniref:metal-dependent hydrolase n=1 Tax=Flexibacterium corallicola TaxID=3037259 RepID=UPI00286EB7FD|nr:metal-dependent hydrolase [Pseudovibrio sp. M1P-2-3]